MIAVYVATDTVGYVNQSPIAPMVDSTWSYQSVEISPTWSGNKVQAVLRISTTSGTTPLYLDEVSLTAPNPDAGEELVQTIGSWRREVLD